nr:unnamed protein product [Callosobruchus chinensis]
MNTYRETQDKFNVSQSTAHCIIKSVLNYLVTQSPDYIYWCQEEQQRKNIHNFYELHEIEGEKLLIAYYSREADDNPKRDVTERN